MAAVRTTTLRDYARYAGKNPREFERLASTFLIKVTEFFRDPDLYQALRTEIIPGLVKEASSSDRELRIWSAGCATGEEAYSLAITVAETLGDDLGLHSVRVFATDVDNEAISFARRGLYSPSAVAKMPRELVDRYFLRVGDDYEIDKRIRAITVFGQHDLAQRAPFPRIDLAVSRNVLIYFTGELQRRALQLFAFSLREGGYLVLGKAETVSPLPEYFALESSRLKIYRRHGERVVIPAPRGLAATPEIASMRPLRLASRDRDEAPTLKSARDIRPTIAERAEQVLLRLPVGVVVLAPDYDIQLINSAARQLLGIHGTALGKDFVHEASGIPSQILREGIERARAGDETALSHTQTARATGADDRILRFTFVPHKLENAGQIQDAVIVIVDDATKAMNESQSLSDRARQTDDEIVGLRRQLSGLDTTNKDLLASNQELTVANAELRSANEELLVGSEEVQAATEEVETLNEELQATNEELETLNEELQATVEELNTTNDDLEARTLELEEMMTALGDKRRTGGDASGLATAPVRSGAGGGPRPGLGHHDP
jgi:two-component system CheB/CheR fusion protein